MASLYLPPLHALFLSVISAPLLFGCNHKDTQPEPYVVAPSVISDKAHAQRETFDIPIGEDKANISQPPPVTTQQLYALKQKQTAIQQKYLTALASKRYQSNISNNPEITPTQKHQAQARYKQANLTALFSQRQLEIMEQQQTGIQQSLVKQQQRQRLSNKVSQHEKTMTYNGMKGVRTGKSFTVRLSLVDDSLLSQESLQQLDSIATSIKKSKQALQLTAYRINTNNLAHDQGISTHHINIIMMQLLKRGVHATQLQKKIKPLTSNTEKIFFSNYPYIDLTLDLS